MGAPRESVMRKKRYEDSLQESQLNEFVQSIDRPSAVFTLEGKLIKANKLAAALLTAEFIKALSFQQWKSEKGMLRQKVIQDDKCFVCVARKIDLVLHQFYFVYIEKENTKREVPVLNNIVGYVMDSAQEGIYITDGEGYTLKINDTYSTITGIAKQDVEGKHVSELIMRGYFDSSVTAKVIKYRQKVSVMQKINNERNIWLVSGTPVFDKYNNLILVINTLYDMTKLNELQERLKKQALSLKEQEREIEKLRSKASEIPGFIAQSRVMDVTVDRINRLSKVDTSVLILGETGTGKNVIAEKIHSLSDRKNGPFIEVNCGAIPESLFESELFGYSKGAFTGAANEGKQGIIESAEGGTLFLDEIGEMPLALQVKLLTVLQNKKVRRVGDVKDRDVDIRIIAATNKEPKVLIEKQKLREDLFYRVSVVTVDLPPLRDRKEDIYLLTKHFLDKFNRKHQKQLKLAKEVYFTFEFYSWPGNIRELEHIVEQLVVLNDGPVVKETDLPESFQQLLSSRPAYYDEGRKPLKELVNDFEKRYIEELWEEHQDIYEVSEKLGLHRTTLLRKAEKLGILLKKTNKD